MADPNYIQRMKSIREKNITRRAGKALIFNEDEMINLISQNKVPTQMQHCIIKVMDKVPGNEKEKFLSAFNICGAVFGKNGYQKPNTTILTPKGLQNNLRHRREVDSGAKSSRYKAIEQRLWSASVKRSEQEKKNKAKKDYEDWKNSKQKTSKQRQDSEKE
jgi:hypothetical protein